METKVVFLTRIFFCLIGSQGDINAELLILLSCLILDVLGLIYVLDNASHLGVAQIYFEFVCLSVAEILNY